MNELIDALVDSLKEEKVYQNYVQAKMDLEKHEALLRQLKQAKEQYLKMRPYFQYQDFSELKQQVTNLAHQVSNLSEYQNYHYCEQALKERLAQLTETIFNGILEEAEVGQCVSLQESINEEI